MPAMKVYIRFCSAQLRSAAFLQQKTETNPEFRELTRKLQGNPETKKLPLSSFLIKPMQRITRYPLLIKKVKWKPPIEGFHMYLNPNNAEVHQRISNWADIGAHTRYSFGQTEFGGSLGQSRGTLCPSQWRSPGEGEFGSFGMDAESHQLYWTRGTTHFQLYDKFVGTSEVPSSRNPQESKWL